MGQSDSYGVESWSYSFFKQINTGHDIQEDYICPISLHSLGLLSSLVSESFNYSTVMKLQEFPDSRGGKDHSEGVTWCHGLSSKHTGCKAKVSAPRSWRDHVSWEYRMETVWPPEFPGSWEFREMGLGLQGQQRPSAAASSTNHEGGPYQPRGRPLQ